MRINKIVLGYLLIISFVVSACHRSGDDNQSQDDSTNIYVRDSLVLQSEHPMLIDFRMFVHDLDSTDMNSAALAVDHFHKFFEGQRPGLCDSAFVVLQQLLDTIETNLNEKLYEDSTDYTPLMTGENVTPKLSRYRNSLLKSGFKISFAEGLPYIEQDREFVLLQLSDMFTEPMKAYLAQIELENREGFAQDAFITIEPEKYIERLVWYEKFMAANKTFVFLDNCKNYRKAYLTYLLSGMDNSPLYDDVDHLQLAEYYAKAYTYLLKKYPDSETAGLVRPYYDAIRNKQKSEVNALYKKYVVAGQVYNFQ